MGLCKCPKRKVTNLFCFEHRVNVCEYCLVDSHANCVVQSYLQWLQDSDFDTNCTLCETPITNGDTVRLQCLHLFHWNCFDAWAHRLPSNTAPAGYRCPYCREAVFPAPNQTSPLIDCLKEKLKSSNWSRAGLGLPVLPELDKQHHSTPQPVSKPREMSTTDIPSQTPIAHSHPVYQSPPTNGGANNYTGNYRSNTPATVLEVDDIYAAQGPRATASSTDITARKKYGDNYSSSRDDNRPLLSREGDADEESNKYKRRPIMQWLGGLWRAKYGDQAPRKVGSTKRAVFILFLVIVAIITIITVGAKMGATDESDPMFDPMANPNIRVGGGGEEHSFQ